MEKNISNDRDDEITPLLSELAELSEEITTLTLKTENPTVTLTVNKSNWDKLTREINIFARLQPDTPVEDTVKINISGVLFEFIRG
tara:strand:+ start:5393 stop:5650 length:258 start_codon:yes stop_codon:yes gene_type:complete